MRIRKINFQEINFEYRSYPQSMYDSVRRIGLSFPVKVNIIDGKYYNNSTLFEFYNLEKRSQIILDNTKLTPGHITSLFVVLGAMLDLSGIYDKIVLYCGAGAIIPITSFGHLLIHGAMDMASKNGFIGLALGIFDLTSAGISIAVVAAFFLALVFKPKH